MLRAVCWKRAFFGSALSVLVAACDTGSASRTPDDIAADSALAADLALANQDTVLIDSIGPSADSTILRDVTPPDTLTSTEAIPSDGREAGIGSRPSASAATRTADPRDADRSRTTASRAAAAQNPTPNRAARAPSQAAAPPPEARERIVVPVDPNVGVGVTPSRAEPSNVPLPPPTQPEPVTTGRRPARPLSTIPSAGQPGSGDPCDTPGLTAQSACVRSLLAQADMRLNRVYRALITEMRTRDGVRMGAGDPTSVERLRAAQRAWLVYRDTECRRRGRGREGPLWARPRVACLGEFSDARADELQENLNRIRQ